ncbi:hypothetical protein J4Q44_G00194730 [Coregonus suidteri]|uniref:PH domain-containing protein n=1 Tax=Coregonus suidteri TaxID=861788 RepID=A0AAN8R244_9TELE
MIGEVVEWNSRQHEIIAYLVPDLKPYSRFYGRLTCQTESEPIPRLVSRSGLSGTMENVYHYTRSPAWEELEPEKGPSTAGIHAHVVGAVGGSGAVDESSDSEGEQEGPQKLIRKVSTSGQLRSKTSVKEGLLLKQTSSFQRWKKRYFKLRGRTLYYAKDAKTGSALARWQERALRGVSRSRVCWRVLSVCWAGPRRTPPASGSEEGLMSIRVSCSTRTGPL